MKVTNMFGQPVLAPMAASFVYKGFIISSSNIMSRNKERFEICIFNSNKEPVVDRLTSIEVAIDCVDNLVATDNTLK